MFRECVKFSFKIAALVAVFVAISFAGEPNNLPEVKAPWMKGEKLTFSLGWGFITAGSATLEVKPIADGKTEFLTHATGNKTTTPLLSVSTVRVKRPGFRTPCSPT